MSNSAHQTQQKRILRSSSPPKKSAAKRSLCLPQNENVSLPSNKGRSLAYNKVFQAIENTTRELCTIDELTTLERETQQKTELTVLVKDANPVPNNASKEVSKDQTFTKSGR